MRCNPFDFNGDGKVDALERAAEFAFFSDMLEDDHDDADNEEFAFWDSEDD